MKRIFIPALSCGLVMMLASSCVSMDMTPNAQGNSESWYSTEAELEMAANRLYTIGYWNSPYEDTEQWTDNFTYRQQNRHPDNGAPLNGDLNGQDYIVYHMWEQDYKQIAQANLILQHSGRAKANGVNEDIINQYRAEAYFARACKYAELISYFGAVPYMEKEMTISEASALGHGRAKVGLDFLEYVDERRRKGHSIVHREAQPLRLARLVVRVLADDYHLHLVKRAQVEGVEYQPSRRVTRALAVLVADKRRKRGEVRLFKLRADVPFPAIFYLHVHVYLYFNDMQK